MLSPDITCDFASAHRRREFYTIRVMARQLGIEPKEILYHDNGAPYINGGPAISISHTKEYAAILLSHDNPRIGVDVEMLSDRFLKVESHYLHTTESCMLRDELPKGMRIEEALGIWWNAKEAMYKAVGEQHIRFTEDFRIYSLAESRQLKPSNDICRFSGELSTSFKEITYRLIYKVLEDFSLVCCFAE